MYSDLTFALRQFIKSPGFTIVAVLTLALGIGANTAIFSVVNAVLLEPLPYEHSERLMQIGEMPNPGSFFSIASGGAFSDWQDESTQFASMAAAHSVDENLTGAGEPVRLSGFEVSAQYFQVFGVHPVFGRDFSAQDDAPGGNQDVVIISNELWQSRLGSDPAIVGKLIHLDGKALSVIGVLPPHALFGNPASFFTPSAIRGELRKLSRDYAYVVSVTGRLKPGATAKRASEELTLSKAAVRSLYPVFKQKWTVGVVSLHDQMFGDLRSYVLTLLAAVGAVLLIACANVANLLLVKASVRQSEIAVRMALGATTQRVVRQLLTESVLLALIGGMTGLILAKISIKPLVVFTGIDAATGTAIGLNARVLIFTLFASCLTGLFFGIFPAMSAARTDLNNRIKEGARGSTSGSRRKTQTLLLISETALTMLLLVCAGLLFRSFANALNADPGFNPENVLVFDVSIPNATAPTNADKVLLGQRIMERMAQIPGVAQVGIASSVPMNGNNGLGDLISREDRPETRNNFSAGFDSVGGDFFQALQIPLLRGRVLTRQDDSEKAPKVVVINDELSRLLFGKEDPLGHILHFKEDTWLVVGVVGSVRRYQLDYQATPQVYFVCTYFPWRTNIVIHTKVPPLTMAQDVRRALKDVDPNLPIGNLGTLQQSISNTLKVRRVMLVLLAIFAATALILACVGIYGVLAYSVTQLTREIGIRIALGSSAGGVIALILRRALGSVLIGVIVGIAASIGAGLLIANQLYGVHNADPLVIGAVAFLLVAVALLASWLPARRACGVNPVIALRAE